MKRLNSLLDKYGLRQTWLNLLATKISKLDKKFKYILSCSEFTDSALLADNILGGLSITDIGVCYEYSLAYVNYGDKKQNGQYFTPEDVSALMAGYAKHFNKGVWYDPCCGVGNLSYYLINSQEDKENFLKKNMVFSDLDELALLISRVMLTVAFQEKSPNLFNDIAKNFIKLDFLSFNENLSLFDTNTLDKIPKHDYCIVNPPYLVTTPNSNFETADCRDTYAYFLENIIKTSKGFISITPQSYTNAEKFRSLRRLLLANYKNLTIYNFDNVPDSIFKCVKFGSTNTNKSNSVRASIMIAGSNIEGRHITSLLRWQSAERETMLASLDKFLSSVALTDNFFPKVNKHFEQFYNTLEQSKTLANIISTTPTDYKLYVPSSPRYFISALKHSVKRASIKTLYFKDEKSMNYAYILLNSSYCYWWWRLRDGGMTLSLETLYSLPLLGVDVKDNIISDLEKSENENKVYKMNAGEMQENVKHSPELLYKINDYVVPVLNSVFLEFHNNSELQYVRI